VAPQLAVLPCVFLLESESLVLVHVGPSNVLNLLQDVQQDVLRASGPLERIFALSYISPSDISGAIDGEGNAVRHLLAPSFRVKPWVVPCLFAGVDMDPSLLVLREDLCPHMIFGVPYPADTTADGTAEHAKAVCPLPAPASPCLQ